MSPVRKERVLIAVREWKAHVGDLLRTPGRAVLAVTLRPPARKADRQEAMWEQPAEIEDRLTLAAARVLLLAAVQAHTHEKVAGKAPAALRRTTKVLITGVPVIAAIRAEAPHDLHLLAVEVRTAAIQAEAPRVRRAAVAEAV